MKFFITGTSTDIGKTIVSGWICLHSNYSYFKPIQTGAINGTDSAIVANLAQVKIHKEAYLFEDPVSPHIATLNTRQKEIDIKSITLPQDDQLIIEGAGGVLVPINNQDYMVDLIKWLDIPVIVVCSDVLGTINHTLLTLEALRNRNIAICGVIISGESCIDNAKSITSYGKIKILAQLPTMTKVTKQELLNIPFTPALRSIFNI